MGDILRYYSHSGKVKAVSTSREKRKLITDNAEHPEVICRWWDNFFELDNSVMSQHGVLDEVLFKQEDGSYTKIDITKESQEVQERNDWGNLWPQSLPKYIPEGFKVKEELEPVYNETEYRDSMYEPYLTEKCVPDQWPDLEHSEEIAELEASIKALPSARQNGLQVSLISLQTGMAIWNSLTN